MSALIKHHTKCRNEHHTRNMVCFVVQNKTYLQKRSAFSSWKAEPAKERASIWHHTRRVNIPCLRLCALELLSITQLETHLTTVRIYIFFSFYYSIQKIGSMVSGSLKYKSYYTEWHGIEFHTEEYFSNECPKIQFLSNAPCWCGTHDRPPQSLCRYSQGYPGILEQISHVSVYKIIFTKADCISCLISRNILFLCQFYERSLFNTSHGNIIIIAIGSR